jgi:two-component system sensor histidine kinase HydH
MKNSLRVSSLAAALLGTLLLTALAVFIIWGMRDRSRLIRDNDNERILNMLFTSLRTYDDFGSAIESNAVLAGRITGFAVYSSDLRPVYQWGKTPGLFDEDLLAKDSEQSRFGRHTIVDPRGRSVKFVINTERQTPPLPEGQRLQPERSPPPRPRLENPRLGNTFFNTLSSGKYFYIDLTHPAYWRTVTVTNILLPVTILCLLLIALYIRHLYLRNREYREKIEAQKNLVVLGTAAATLAHEIKNPLLSIRIQTSILEKSLSGGNEELTLINQEVDRLSELTNRVRDYLREGAGNPAPCDVRALLEETSRRLCGRDIINSDSIATALIHADSERFRSVFENLIRNALESGGKEEEVKASVSRENGGICIRIVDKGGGIASEDLERAFEPFFTRKSTGTGIGLSISRRFVEAAGGKLSLENLKDGGLAAIIHIAECNDACADSR